MDNKYYVLVNWKKKKKKKYMIWEIYREERAREPTLDITPTKFWRIRIAPMVNKIEIEN